MSRTKIEWCDYVWNPTRGCSRVSEGCRNCYAEAIAARFSTHSLQNGDVPGGVFAGFASMTKSGPRWTGKVELVESKLLEPLRWKKPRRVFVNSMSDLFHEALPDEAIDRVFAAMALCPQLTFQVLTKRPERMQDYMTAPDRRWSVEDAGGSIPGVCYANTQKGWPLPNVWLGVSVENQATADERIDVLLDTPAALRFVSYEPALGPVDFFRWVMCKTCFEGRSRHPFECDEVKLDWVIAGGESGRGARPARPSWFQSARDQCVAAGVPFFFKQWGEYLPDRQNGSMTKAGRALATDSQAIRVGKKAAGALLDGREWKQFPQPTTAGKGVGHERRRR